MACCTKDESYTFIGTQPRLLDQCSPGGIFVRDTIGNVWVKSCPGHAMCRDCKEEKGPFQLNIIQDPFEQPQPDGCKLVCNVCRISQAARLLFLLLGAALLPDVPPSDVAAHMPGRLQALANAAATAVINAFWQATQWHPTRALMALLHAPW